MKKKKEDRFAEKIKRVQWKKVKPDYCEKLKAYRCENLNQVVVKS